MSPLIYTPIDEIPKIRDELRATFRSGITRPLEWRKDQLYRLAHLVQNEANGICDALSRDFAKPRFEVMGEIRRTIERILISAEQLGEWNKPEQPDVPESLKGRKPTIYKAPVGTVLVISPWNAPVILTMQPFIGVIAAGCCAVIKLSELVPHFSSLIADLIPKYLDPAAYRVVNGAIPETTKLLELQWDHITYTGNGKVGRIVASAAAKHLTPCLLELGGKSPVYVDSTYDMDLAAKRILYGKCNNAGQICIAPDYVLVPRQKQDELIQALEKAYKAFFPNGALGDVHYGSIVNDIHFKRITNLLDRSKGEIVSGVMQGRRNPEQRQHEPVVVKNVKADDSLLEEEIFGPILPVVPVDGLDEAIEFINERPHPLALYAFTEDSVTKERFIHETRSGGVVFNDTLSLVSQLPFGGMGESGYGYQGLKYSFEPFVHLRSSVDVPKEAESALSPRYFPRSDQAIKYLEGEVNQPIPSSL